MAGVVASLCLFFLISHELHNVGNESISVFTRDYEGYEVVFVGNLINENQNFGLQSNLSFSTERSYDGFSSQGTSVSLEETLSLNPWECIVLHKSNYNERNNE